MFPGFQQHLYSFFLWVLTTILESQRQQTMPACTLVYGKKLCRFQSCCALIGRAAALRQIFHHRLFRTFLPILLSELTHIKLMGPRIVGERQMPLG